MKDCAPLNVCSDGYKSLTECHDCHHSDAEPAALQIKQEHCVASAEGLKTSECSLILTFFGDLAWACLAAAGGGPRNY